MFNLNEHDIGVYSCRAKIELDEGFNTITIDSLNNFILKLNFVDSSLYPSLVYLTSNANLIRTYIATTTLECFFKNYEIIEWSFGVNNQLIKNSNK